MTGLGIARRRLVADIVTKNWDGSPETKKFSFNEVLFVIQEMLDEEGKQYLQGGKQNKGRHGYTIFREFVKYLLYRNLANYDSMILMTSEKGCITGDALLEMPRDLKKYPKGVPLKELEGKGEIYVYCLNTKTKELELKKSDGVEFVKEDDVWEVELTNGMKIKATKDHPFLQVDGTYKRLDDLFWHKHIFKSGKKKGEVIYGRKGSKRTDRLQMVVRFGKSLRNDNFRINYAIKPKLKRNEKNKKEHNFIFEQLHGIIPEKHLIHHKNGKHYDNNIENLQLVTHSEHSKIHAYGNLCDSKNYNKDYKRPEYKTKQGSKECCIVHSTANIKWRKENPEKADEYNLLAKNIRCEASKLQNGGIIKSIKYIGKEKVYDVVNVKDNHNFIVNGFVVSNTGKSSAAMMLAREWMRLQGKKFDPDRHIAYNNADVMNKIDRLDKFEAIVCDESIRFASSTDWAKRENKELKKKLAQVRTKHLLYILCFPLKVEKLEKTYLESFVNYWCLSGDSEILIKHQGKVKKKKIKDLTNLKEYQVASYNINTKEVEYKNHGGCVKTKENAEVYEIELENGDKIKATKEHKFLTQDGYRRLIDLKKDKLLDCVTNYVKIKSIKKLEKKEDVYDILSVEDNNNFIANNMVVHNCDLFGRGQGAIYVKDRNPAMDAWRISDFKKLGSYTEFSSLSKVESILKKHPNFWNIIKYPKPPDFLYNRYLKVREKNVYDDDNVMASVSKEDIHKALLILSLRDVMQHDDSLSMSRIILHIKNEYDITLTKSMIQNILDDSKQLVQKIRENLIKKFED